MAFPSPVCCQNWYWLYQTLRGAFSATVQFIFSHLWLLIQYCKIAASETEQVCMLPSNWKWIHIPSAGICSTLCCAETPLSPIAITPLGLLSLPRDHKPQHYWSPNARCWLGLGVCSVCSAHVFYIVCQRFTSLSASGLLPGLRELPASVSFTTAGNFPLRLCFDNLVKGLAFTECFAVQTHPSLLPRIQHFPKMTVLAHWANHLLVHFLCSRHPTYKYIAHILWATTATQMPIIQFHI